MPLIGDFYDFPLPEVLMFIGPRSGRLKISGVPFFGRVEMDFDHGEVLAMHAGGETLVEVEQILANLSVVVRMGKCQFEFVFQPVQPVQRESPLTITQLVFSLVRYVDDQMSRQKAVDEAQDPKNQVQEQIFRKATGFLWAANAAREVRRITKPLAPPLTRPE